MKAAWTLAALLALGGAAEAHPKTAVVSLDGHCDVVTLQIDKGAVAGTDAASCAAGFGAGYVGKVKKFGNAIVAALFLTMLHSLGGAGVFAVFAAFTVIALVVVYRYAPETKDRQLEEIQHFWENGGRWD